MRQICVPPPYHICVKVARATLVLPTYVLPVVRGPQGGWSAVRRVVVRGPEDQVDHPFHPLRVRISMDTGDLGSVAQ